MSRTESIHIPERPITPRLPLAHHQKSIGTKVEFRQSGRGKSKHVFGTVTDVRHGIGEILDMKTGQRWHVIEIKIKPDDGSRAFWTRFADRAETKSKKKADAPD